MKGTPGGPANSARTIWSEFIMVPTVPAPFILATQVKVMKCKNFFPSPSAYRGGDLGIFPSPTAYIKGELEIFPSPTA